jgi:hypothetical protein
MRRIMTLLIVVLVTLTACGPAPTAAPTVAPKPTADLSGIKTYLLGKAGELKSNTASLKSASDRYYDLAKASHFDYAKLWNDNPGDVSKALTDAKTAWVAASPLYEQIEGIVAGVPSLAEYDVILDAGASAEEDPEGAAPFDLTLPDSRVLPKPGNLFGVTESTLWGTYPDFTIADVKADLDGDGTLEFGESLPEANVLKAGADALDSYTAELNAASQKWEPTESDAFTALVVMIPTMSEYFDSWKNSRFVAGDAATQRDFVAVSRLSDIQNILGSLQVVYVGVKPLAESADSAQAAQIETGLGDLKSFVGEVYTQEQGGKKFTAEDADLLGAEAQNRATALAGQVSQVAAKLNIKLEQ